MKKKLILPLMIILAICTLFAGCSDSISLTNSVGEIKYKVVDDHAEVVALPNGSKDTDIVIADEYEGKPVTKINDFAGNNLESAETITLGKNVEEIGPWAFSNNQKLTGYVVADGNEHFCTVDGALYSKDITVIYSYPCASNDKYIMPSTVETVAERAFYKNENIKSITFSKKLKEIKVMAFFQCSALENFTLPSSIETIGKDAFTRCITLTKLTIPSSIQQIDEYAFYNCTELKDVKVDKKKDDIKLGTKWYPTNNGNKIDGLKLEYKE